MTETNEERELRARFTRMREDDRARVPAPAFDRMIERARPVDVGTVTRIRHLVRVAGWATVAAAATVAAVLMADRTRSDVEFDRLVVGYSNEVATGLWDSPTSGLMRVPGYDLLGSVPALGPGALPDLSIDPGDDGP